MDDQLPEVKNLLPMPAVKPPADCRQRLAAEGKSYPRSSCTVCGQFSPRWKECDAMLAAAPVPPAGDVEVVARVIATGGPHDTEDRVLCEQVAELPPVGTELIDRANATRLTAERGARAVQRR